MKIYRRDDGDNIKLTKESKNTFLHTNWLIVTSVRLYK